MVRPVFVSRAKRETLKNETRDGEEAADADAEWAARDEAHRRKRAEESRRLLELELERETAIANAEANADASDVDTDDELEDPSVAYQAWRLRELARIEEDEKTRDRMFAEREEQEKIRRMSEAEKKKYFDAHPELRRGLGDETKAGGATSQGEKPKLGFMQKYYHKGAFFQEAADDAFGTASTHEIYARDFSAATGGDRGVDKSALPKAMQVRGDKFGKVGQTKWTHLANEDTSRLATERPQHRKAGKEQSFEKPSRKI
jgi:microfibrillar-associated protein 1